SEHDSRRMATGQTDRVDEIMKRSHRKHGDRVFICRVVVLLALLLLITAGRSTSAQAPAPWGGWVQCRFDVQGTGYTHQEVQTWTITGPPVMQSTVEVYPASWSVTGQGTLRKIIDASTTEASDWTVAVPTTV